MPLFAFGLSRFAGAASLSSCSAGIASDPQARRDVNPLQTGLALKLGLRLVGALKGEKGKVRRLESGIVAFGDADLPVPLYAKHRACEAETSTSSEATAKGEMKGGDGTGEWSGGNRFRGGSRLSLWQLQ